MKKLILGLTIFCAAPAWAAEPVITKLTFDNLERHIGDDETLAWDATFWAGRDRDKFQIETTGEKALGGNVEEAQISAFYRRMVSPFFDAKVGLRHDLEPGDALTHLAVGIEGLAPQWWEVDGQAFLSEDGNVTASFDGELDLRLTQRLILQPNVEVDWSAQRIATRAVGAGITQASAALRLRYQVSRNIAPYMGWEWHRKFGGTARYAQAAGEGRTGDTFLIGLTGWF